MLLALAALVVAAQLGGVPAVAMVLPAVGLLALLALQLFPGERTLARLAERRRRALRPRARRTYAARRPRPADLLVPCGLRALRAHGRRGPPALSCASA